MPKHTPGPWKIFNAWQHKGVIAFSRIGNDEKSVIRSENTQTDIYATNEADLHLIGAAPDLLQALELAVRYLDHPETKAIPFAYPVDTAIQQVKNAIAKAKGETTNGK